MASYRRRPGGWQAEVFVGGIRKFKTLPTKAEVKAWAVNMEYELGQLAAGVSTTHTMGDVFIRYADEVSQAKRGERWELFRLAAFGRDVLASVLLVDVRREHLESWIVRRLKKVEPSSVNRELNLLSHCLTQARRWRLMDHNPMEDLKRPKNPPPRFRRYAQHEIEKILVALKYSEDFPVTMQQQRAAVALLFVFETGMRAGEVCSLIAPNVDLTKKTAFLPMTKNGLPRYVPLSNEAVRLLKRLEPWPLPTLDEDTGEEIPVPIFRMNSSLLSTTFKKGVALTGIEDLTFHDSRHEAITRLAAKLDVLDLARTVGHADIKQLMIYYNKSAEELAGQLG